MKKMNFYKQIVENISDGIMLCDEFFNVIYINKTFKILTDYNENEVLNKNFSEFITFDKEFTTEQTVYHGKITTKQDEDILVKLNCKKIEDDSKQLFLISITPLSDTSVLSQAHLDFVSTVSHELRTPLTSIKGFADTLLSAGDKIPKEQQIRFIGIIKTQVDRLTRLVENLLTVSRLEAKKSNSIYKAVDISKMIEPIIQAIQVKAPNHKFKFNFAHNLPEIWADSDKLEQIFTNLIDNAVKYSFPETIVTISAKFSPENQEFIDISVSDQGVGIPDDFLSKIFTKFSRIDNPLTREVQGTGLGLYITKSLIEQMQGKILVSNNKTAQGVTFTVRMPVVSCEKQAAQNFISSQKY